MHIFVILIQPFQRQKAKYHAERLFRMHDVQHCHLFSALAQDPHQHFLIGMNFKL
jgi:hypothetical protein